MSENNMNSNQDIVAGLDIGTTKIACIVGRRNEQGKIEVLGMGKSRSEGVTRGVVANIPKTVESIKAAVQEASDMAGWFRTAAFYRRILKARGFRDCGMGLFVSARLKSFVPFAIEAR